MAAIDALEQLGPVAAHQTIPALRYLIAHISNRQVKEHARAVLGRLTMQSALGTEDAAMADAHQHQLQFHEARVSFLDGTGSQMIMLSWRRPDGSLQPARGQARIPSLSDAKLLMDLARELGWGDRHADD